MKTISIFIAILFLSACSDYTNEMLVRDAKYCTENGMDYRIFRNVMTYKPKYVHCEKP